MEKRVLLAIFLSFLVLYLYQALVVKPPPPPPGAPPATSSSGASPAPTASGAPPASATAPPRVEAPAAAARIGDPTERDVRVETGEVIAVFTNRGARLKSWRLKHYLDVKQEPLELVAGELAHPQPLPFSLRVDDEAVTATMNGALYAVQGNGLAASSPLKFEYENSELLHVVKEFHFGPGPYVVTVRVKVTKGRRAAEAAGDAAEGALPNVAIQWGPAVADVIYEAARSMMASAQGVLAVPGSVRRLSVKDFAAQPAHEGEFLYAGVDDQYFLTAALLAGRAKITFHPVAIPPPAGSSNPPHELVSYAVEPSAPRDVKFFAGPKDFDVLKSVDPAMVQAIDFGMFRFLVVPLLQSLKWINGYVGNYGWSIILLTVIINAIMFPLRHKSVVSMRKMQELQPEVKAIQDRYAKLKTTDPARQKMNQELMALYKERGVNPASGCVPMLLTLPVLFAFYSLLTIAIELRGAPFVGWIHDLSVHDPYYVTPILMGLSQLWQQRITPATGTDPIQQKMMMLMPIIFTFMFLWAPAGVALYWFVSNIWGIGQQYLTNYLIGPPAVRTVRPPAQRQLKRVGGGKTEAAAREPKTITTEVTQGAEVKTYKGLFLRVLRGFRASRRGEL